MLPSSGLNFIILNPFPSKSLIVNIVNQSKYGFLLYLFHSVNQAAFKGLLRRRHIFQSSRVCFFNHYHGLVNAHSHPYRALRKNMIWERLIIVMLNYILSDKPLHPDVESYTLVAEDSFLRFLKKTL